MISVIIPTYNEESRIKKTLDCLSGILDTEIIVVDGASSDNTYEIARTHSAKAICSQRGRACQMNKGAQEAKGDILLFLHADANLEEGSLEEVGDCIKKGFLGGCFVQKIKSSKLIYRFIEKSGNIRAKCSKIFYGDQAIFVKKKVFYEIGGFDNVDLFEDVLFSRKLRKMGKVYISDKKVFTSPRRWEREGVIKTTIIHWLLSLGFMLGFHPDRLRRLYRDVR